MNVGRTDVTRFMVPGPTNNDVNSFFRRNCVHEARQHARTPPWSRVGHTYALCLHLVLRTSLHVACARCEFHRCCGLPHKSNERVSGAIMSSIIGSGPTQRVPPTWSAQHGVGLDARINPSSSASESDLVSKSLPAARRRDWSEKSRLTAIAPGARSPWIARLGIIAHTILEIEHGKLR